MKWCKSNFCYSLVLVAILFWVFIFLDFEAVDVNLNQEKELIAHELHVDAVSRRPPLHTTNNVRSTVANSVTESWLCEPHNNIQVLFFNRIAKCASTSFVELLQELSHVGNYDVIFDRRGAYDWKHQEVALITAKINEVIEGGKRIAYAQHFYYTDFSPYLHNYAYVTLVRDPVERMVSSFNYYHYSTKEYIKRMLPKERRHETLLDCVQMEHEGCKHNLMTKYFCGHSHNCSNGSSEALKVAKYNLKNNFIAVGLVENLTLSVQLFQRLIPAYFPPVADLTILLPYTNQNKKTALADSQTIKAIKLRNQADMELYQYAKELFFNRLKACSI